MDDVYLYLIQLKFRHWGSFGIVFMDVVHVEGAYMYFRQLYVHGGMRWFMRDCPNLAPHLIEQIAD